MAAEKHGGNGQRIEIFWKAHVRAHEKSGLSLAEYCRRQGLSYHAFRYWRKKLSRSSDDSKVALVEVGRFCVPGNRNIPAGSDSSSDLRVRIKGRYTVDVKDGFSASTLSRVITVLESL